MTVRVPGRLHVLTDETLQSRFSHLELASLAIEGGADVVQFREKRSRPRAALVELVREIAECVHDAHAILVVNDRVELALEAGADGVPLGAGDAAPGFARELLGPRAWIGGTANDLERVREIAGTPLDYLGVAYCGSACGHDPNSKRKRIALNGYRPYMTGLTNPAR